MRLFALLFLISSLSTELSAQKYLLSEDVNNDTLIPKFGFKRKYDMSNYFGLGFMAGGSQNNPPSEIHYGRSINLRAGFWGRMKLNNWYALGFYTEFSKDRYHLKTPFYSDSLSQSQTAWTKQNNNNLVVGIFNRININSDNLFLDLGAYYAYDFMPRIITKVKPENANFHTRKNIYNRPDIMNRSNYGLDIRITWGSFALYSRYRISGLYKNQSYDLPKMVFGIIIDPKN